MNVSTLRTMRDPLPPNLKIKCYEPLIARFSELLKATSIGSQTLAEWTEYVAGCKCADLERGKEDCQAHATMRACHDYCNLIDQDWLRIADWYRRDAASSLGANGRDLYQAQVTAVRARGQTFSDGMEDA